MSKQFTFIISGGDSYSISNDTDADPMSDYSPGIWAISSLKSALKFARQYIAEGHTMRVTTYNNARHAVRGNEVIKALGIDQPLFDEPAAVPASSVTDYNAPRNLAMLKKALPVGTPVRVVNYTSNGPVSRDTTIVIAQSNSWAFDKNGTKSWLEHGKASDWSFDNLGATKYYTANDGTVRPSTRIEYITNTSNS